MDRMRRPRPIDFARFRWVTRLREVRSAVPDGGLAWRMVGMGLSGGVMVWSLGRGTAGGQII